MPSPLAPLPVSGEGKRVLPSPLGGRRAGVEGVVLGGGLGLWNGAADQKKGFERYVQGFEKPSRCPQTVDLRPPRTL